MYLMSSCLSCPVLVFSPMCPTEGPMHLLPLQIRQSVPDGFLWDLLRADMLVSPRSANIHGDLLYPQLLPLSVTKADWMWLKEVMPQLILLHCHALPNRNHTEQQHKEQPLARRHSHNSSYSMPTSVIIIWGDTRSVNVLENFLRRALSSAETSASSEYFLPQHDFLVALCLRWLLLLQRWRWYSQLILTKIVQ